jgi:hypothetical protein
MYRKIILTVFTLLAVQTAHAQSISCGMPYAKMDRSALKIHLDSNVQILQFLQRLNYLATFSQYEDLIPSQRLALNIEFQNRVREITARGATPVLGFKPRTNAWLNRIIDSQFLGLQGLDISTPSSAQIAEQATLNASSRFLLCY